MDADVARTWAYEPSLLAELPEGWSVAEAATFVSPAGTPVRVRVDPAPPGATPASLAERAEALARAELGEGAEVVASELTLPDGTAAAERRFRAPGPPARWARVVCWLAGARSVTVSASWDPERDGGRADADLGVVLGGLGLTGPVGGEAPGGSPAPGPAVRPPLAAGAWDELRSAWSQPPAAPEEAEVVGRWSAAELAVLATIVGDDPFPTIGAGLLTSMPLQARRATVDAVTRSLRARGLVAAGPDGRAVLAEDLHAVVATAVAPDLAVSAVGSTATTAAQVHLAVRPGSAVVVEVLDDGIRELRVAPTAHALAAALAAAGVDLDEPGAPGDPPVSRLPVGDALDEAVRAFVAVGTTWSAGDGRGEGGTFGWAVGTGGGGWPAELRADEGGVGWELQPAQGRSLRSLLLEHLPHPGAQAT